ncbi:hypothetical protein HGRIS_007136 [Hohenbuehelia grisea]|uniref:Pheromone receptor n=1 Tax=Hohenbuehelia grisea TaxID=104357 RepID=A0ABR3JB49_9AGAR
MDPTYPLFPIFAFLGFILSLVPLPFHFQAWNSGTCYFMIWSALACLNQFINSVVWVGHTRDVAPVFCEISTRILMGSSVGIPAASLCINRRLYHIASVQAVSVTRAEKRRDILIDTAICVLFPMIYIALQYVVQGHRYNILEDLGCKPALYNTIPTYFISYSWPIIIGLISVVYCTLTLRCFFRRRVQFSQFLSSNKNLTAGRYFRLMALATTEMLLTLPLAIVGIWINTKASPISPWISWEDTHYGFSRVDQIPAMFWRRSVLVVIGSELTRWFTPFCAFVFFAFFGFADEARRYYMRVFWSAVKPFGFHPPKPSNKGSEKLVISIGSVCQLFLKACSSLTLSFDRRFEKHKGTDMTSISSLPVYTPPPAQTLKHYPSTTSSFSATCPRRDSQDAWTLVPSPASGSSFSFSVYLDPIPADHNSHRISLPPDFYESISASASMSTSTSTSSSAFSSVYSDDRNSLISIPPVAIAI